MKSIPKSFNIIVRKRKLESALRAAMIVGFNICDEEHNANSLGYGVNLNERQDAMTNVINRLLNELENGQ